MHNLVHITREYGWFIGQFDHNRNHRHSAVQVTIPLSDNVQLETETDHYEITGGILIKPNHPHRLISETPHLLILFNPFSSKGHYWNRSFIGEISELPRETTTRLKSAALNPGPLNSSQEAFVERMASTLDNYDCDCNDYLHAGDERIEKAISYINLNADRVIPLKEIASHCHLSTSRFLHLFKEETGLTYRRAQLWTRLSLAIPKMAHQTLTEIAYLTGFSDSAHLSRTFSENLGFSPREFLNFSRFIQV